MSTRTVEAVFVNPGEQGQTIRVGADLDALREAIGGGYLESITGDGWHIYVDDESAINGMPVNVLGSEMLYALMPHMRGRETLHGPVLLLGQDDDGDEADVPIEVLDLLCRSIAVGPGIPTIPDDQEPTPPPGVYPYDDDRVVKLAAKVATGTRIALQPGGSSPDARLLRLTATTAARVLVDHGWVATRTGVPLTRVTMEVLRRLGHTAKPLSCSAMHASRLAEETHGEKGASIGIIGTGDIDPQAPSGATWDGYLVLLVDGQWLLDVNAPIFDRPGQGLPMPEALLWRLPERSVPLVDGVTLSGRTPHGNTMRYTINDHTEWRELPDWAGKHARVGAAVDEAVNLIGPYHDLLQTAQTSDSGKLWRCRTCHTGLKTVLLPDGTVQYLHARPWEITDGHDPIPEHVDRSADVKKVCDFCSDPDPTWSYIGPDILVDVTISPFTGERVTDGEERLGAEWAGCDRCDPFIVARDLEGLLHSAVRSRRNRQYAHDPRFVDLFRRKNWPRWSEYIPQITRRRMLNPPALEAINPRTLPKIRNRLVRFLTEQGYAGFGVDDGFTLLPGPDMDMPDAMTVLAPKVPADAARSYTDRVIGGLEQADLFYVSDDFTSLAMMSGAELPDLSVTPEELPARHGLIMWAQPVMTVDALQTHSADEAQMVAASWTTVTDLGVWINWYARTDQLAPGNTTMREQAGWLIPWTKGTGLKYGQSYTPDMASPPPEQGFPAHDRDGLAAFRILLATWFLIMQPGVAQVDEQTTNDKQMIKKAKRAGLPAPTVRLVDLRHARHARHGDGDGQTRARSQISVRFPVRGHWRDQAWGKGRKLRRRMYIAPFMKGHDGLPLKQGAAVVKVLK